MGAFFLSIWARFKVWLFVGAGLAISFLGLWLRIQQLEGKAERMKQRAENARIEAESAKLDQKVTNAIQSERTKTEHSQAARRQREKASGRKHNLGRRWGSKSEK